MARSRGPAVACGLGSSERWPRRCESWQSRAACTRQTRRELTLSAGPHEKPPHAVLFEMLFGAWTAKILSEIVRLDVPDALAAGPMTADELVRKAGIRAHPVALHRALRACAALGIVTEDSVGRFGPTRLSALLTRDAPSTSEALRRILGRLAVEGVVRSAGRARDGRASGARAARHGVLRLPGGESQSSRGVRRDRESAQRRREQGRDGAVRLRGHSRARRRRRELRALGRSRCSSSTPRFAASCSIYRR